MSIVKYIKDEMPIEGSVVYCDNGAYSSDRATFKDGKFIGGGEFPQKEYAMTRVKKWFYMSEYMEHHKKTGLTCFSLGFDVAEMIEG